MRSIKSFDRFNESDTVTVPTNLSRLVPGKKVKFLPGATKVVGNNEEDIGELRGVVSDVESHCISIKLDKEHPYFTAFNNEITWGDQEFDELVQSINWKSVR